MTETLFIPKTDLLLEDVAITITEFTTSFQKLLQWHISRTEALKKGSNVASDKSIFRLQTDFENMPHETLRYVQDLPEEDIIANITACKFKLLSFSHNPNVIGLCNVVNHLAKNETPLRLHSASYTHLVALKETLIWSEDISFCPVIKQNSLIVALATMSNVQSSIAFRKISNTNTHFTYENAHTLFPKDYALVFEY